MTNLNLMRLLVMYNEEFYRNVFYTNIKSEIKEVEDTLVAKIKTEGEELRLELNPAKDYIKATIDISTVVVEIPMSLAVSKTEVAVSEMWSEFCSC